jgi:ABC-type transport system substrate-binding protein
MTTGYWSSSLRKRVSRRRAVVGGTLLGAGGAALLIGCGGSDGDSDDGNALVSQPVDSTRQAVKGGIMQSHLTSEGLHFDPTTATSAIYAHSSHAYSRLVRYKIGTVADPPDGSVEGDVAASWEMSPDGTTVTMKLRPNMKFDQRAPTNGRNLTVDDVRWSWDKISTLSPDRGNWSNKVASSGPIDSFQFPDSSTIVAKLAFPMGTILRKFAGVFYIAPVEAEDKFDVRQEQRGSGPWMMTKYERSAGWEYRRNPNWYEAAQRPYLDGIDYALMSETATQLAQFSAKRLWTLAPPADQVAAIKRDNPTALLQAVNPLGSGVSGGSLLTISKLADSPLQKDVRLRHAISMLIDRDAFIEAFYNVSKLEAEGLPMQTGWNSHIACTCTEDEGLDPQSNKLGDAAKYFQHNPDEAAKLIRAAGKYPMETEFSYQTTAGSATTTRQMEVLSNMLQEGGHFKLKVNNGDYPTWYQPTYLRARAQYEGIAYCAGGGGDLDAYLWGRWAPGSGDDMVYDWSRVPGLEEIMLRFRREIDEKKRLAAVHDFQREMAKQMPAMMFPGVATNFTLYWPWMGNAGVHRTPAGTGVTIPHLYTWYDKSKDTRTA